MIVKDRQPISGKSFMIMKILQVLSRLLWWRLLTVPCSEVAAPDPAATARLARSAPFVRAPARRAPMIMKDPQVISGKSFMEGKSFMIMAARGSAEASRGHRAARQPRGHPA